jgi:hypothetical protein
MYPLKPIEITVKAAWEGREEETVHVFRPATTSEQLSFDREIEQALVGADDDRSLGSRFHSAGMIIEAKVRLYDQLIISVRGYDLGGLRPGDALRVAESNESPAWREIIPPAHKARAIDGLTEKKMPPLPRPAPPSSGSTNTGGGTSAAPEGNDAHF